MRPGEAAVMKASLTRVSARAACRLRTSRSTSARPWEVTGPMQLGFAAGGRPWLGGPRSWPGGATRWRAGAGGGGRRAGWGGRLGARAETGEALLDIGGVGELALLAVVHDVHAGGGLARDDGGDRLARAVFQHLRVVGLAAIAGDEERRQIVGP